MSYDYSKCINTKMKEDRDLWCKRNTNELKGP